MRNSSFKPNMSHSSIDNEWKRPALAACHILKWIGGYLCFVFIFGIALNSFVLYTLIKKKYLQSPISIYIIALSSADLIHALFGIPLPLTSNLACRWLYGKYLCYYEGFMAYFVGMIGLYLLTTLSLNRYWMIVTPYKTNCVTFQTAYISVFISILGGLFWAIAPVFGWNNYTLEGVLTSCSIRWQDRTLNVVSYNILMFIFAYILPLFIIIYCNIKIYLKVYDASQRRIIWTKNLNTFQTHQKQNIEKLMAKKIFIIIRLSRTFILVTFIIAWTPYAIVAFISSFFSPNLISPLGGTLPAIFAKSSICFNPLVYIMTNSRIHLNISYWRKKFFKPDESISSKEKNDRSYPSQLQLIPRL